MEVEVWAVESPSLKSSGSGVGGIDLVIISDFSGCRIYCHMLGKWGLQ